MVRKARIDKKLVKVINGKKMTIGDARIYSGGKLSGEKTLFIGPADLQLGNTVNLSDSYKLYNKKKHYLVSK